MTRLEQIHKQSPTPANLKALVAVKTELNMDHTCHVQKLLLYTQQKYYEFGNKSSRRVNSTFRDFYKSLHSAEQVDAMAIALYLNNIYAYYCKRRIAPV